MDIKFNALAHATYLIGIITALRRLYKPLAATPTAMAAALDRLGSNEQRALTHIALMARSNGSVRLREPGRADP